MQIKLDVKDKKILFQLDSNARQSSTSIAKKVGLSPEVVNYRIKNFEEEGIIKGYHTLINFPALGYITFRVYIKLMYVTPEIEEQIFTFLTKDKKVLFVLKTEGMYDLSFGVIVKDIYEFSEFYEECKRKFNINIKEEVVSLYTSIYHYPRKYLLNDSIRQTKIIQVHKSPVVKYDSKDLLLLHSLSGHARITLLELSRQLKMPPRTIAFRIKQLIKKEVILGFKPILSFEKIGIERYRVEISLGDTSKLKSLIDYCASIGRIINLIQTVPGRDIEILIEAESHTEATSIIALLRKEYSQIKEITQLSLGEYKKYLYFPEE